MKSILKIDMNDIKCQMIINAICNHLDIPEVTIMPLNEDYAKNNGVMGEYSGKRSGFYQMRILVESDIITALHELCHHVQNVMEYDVNTPHDCTFSCAAGKITTAIKKMWGKDAFPHNKDILRTINSQNCKSLDRLHEISTKK